MKLLTRDISAYRFMVLGGLLSRKKLPQLGNLPIPNRFTPGIYRKNFKSFGVDEENVRNYLIDLLSEELGWKNVKKKHDILAATEEDKLLIECKKYKPDILYLEDHKGGNRWENGVEELQRNIEAFQCKWGILTDGATFRLYYNSKIDRTFSECFLEISLIDIMNSSIQNPPYELLLLIDILSPNSRTRSIDPAIVEGLSNKDIKNILSTIKKFSIISMQTVIKALAVAALEDMGVRSLHLREIKSIREAYTKEEFEQIFENILSEDMDFHSKEHFISDELCKEIHILFKKLTHIDFAHVDHEFFGTIYQKLINNGNASHYTNSLLSKEMANYLACRNKKSQKSMRPIYLKDNDFLIDPAVGSGQLLRALLPFHRVFFSGQTHGIDGWRKLAKHFIARDIDKDAIWVSKINIWLSTAKKGDPFLNLDNFKQLDVIDATINRLAGESIKQAFRINKNYNIVGCVSNPPWDAFKNDNRRGVSFNKDIVEKIKRSLDIHPQQLNRAQIFLRIIGLLGEEVSGMRFAIILPDSIFVDKNDNIRNKIKPYTDFYFSYPRNRDTLTKQRIFRNVDNTRKFGIIFGRSGTKFQKLYCYPFGKGSNATNAIKLNDVITTIGKNRVLPLFSDYIQVKIIKAWKNKVTRYPKWKEGEFHQSLWGNKKGRKEEKNGDYKVIGGNAFCKKDQAWSIIPDENIVWKRMSYISKTDDKLRNSDRVIFSDYINNSNKLNSATYLSGAKKLNIINTLLYSCECKKNDTLIYDSPIFSTFVEVYGTSQHMNSWRLTALGLPNHISSNYPLQASAELAASVLELTLKECEILYDLYSDWLSLSISKEEWQYEIEQYQPASLIKQKEALEKVKKARKKAERKRKKVA